MALQTSAETDNPITDARHRPSTASGGPGGLLRGEDSVTNVFWRVTSSSSEDETLPKEQTRFRSKANRSQKYAGDPTYTCAASSRDRNRTVRADFSSKTLWAPPCNRQPSNIIIIVCDIFSFFSVNNDRSHRDVFRAFPRATATAMRARKHRKHAFATMYVIRCYSI